MSQDEITEPPRPTQEIGKRLGALAAQYSKKLSEVSALGVARLKTEGSIAKSKGDQLALSRQRTRCAQRVGELILQHRERPEVVALGAVVPSLPAELEVARQLDLQTASQATEIEALRGKRTPDRL